MPKTRPIAERFWEKVKKSGPVPKHMPHLGECWTWLSGFDRDGYGMIWVNEEIRGGRASRVAWLVNYGEDPGKLWVLHKCDNPGCVRPDHLFLGTASDNARDRESKGRRINSPPINQPGLKSCRHLFNKKQIKSIRFQYIKKGCRLVDLAKKYRVTHRTISLIVRGISYPDIPCPEAQKNYRNRSSKRRFSEDQIHEIRRYYADGFSQEYLAKRFKINQSNISAIVRCVAYAHIK